MGALRAVLVSGDRSATQDDWIGPVHDALSTKPDCVVHGNQGYIDKSGAAHGIDTIVDVVAKELNLWKIMAFSADWGALGKKAGPIRNRQMVRYLADLRRAGYECRVIAFHDDLEHSRGTGDLVRQATREGFGITLVRSDGSSELLNPERHE